MEIEIDISNPVLFALAAYILDQEEVLIRIKEIRKSWNLARFIPYEEFDNWLNEPHIDFVLTPEAAGVLSSAVERLDTDTQHDSLSSYESFIKNKQLSEVRVIDYELEYTLHKLNLDLKFKPLLLRAIVCNKVTIHDFPEANKGQKETKRDISDEKSMQKYTKVHFFDKEVKTIKAKSAGKYKKVQFSEKLIKVKKSEFQEDFDEWLFDGLYSYNNPKNLPSNDTKPEIARDRQWYLLHKAGRSYLQISKNTKYRGKIDANDYRETVKKQVKRYEKDFLKGGHLVTQ